jgi:hypothetical protein
VLKDLAARRSRLKGQAGRSPDTSEGQDNA